MKEKIVLKVINTERNLDLLEQVPHLNMVGLGLSVVFYVSLMTGEQSAGILIKNEHLKLWEKTVSDLLTVAEINTNRMHAFIIKSMNEVLSGMFGFEEDLIPEDVPVFYVLTDETVFSTEVNIHSFEFISGTKSKETEPEPKGKGNSKEK